MYREHIKTLALFVFFGLLAGVILLWKMIVSWLCGDYSEGKKDKEESAEKGEPTEEGKFTRRGFFISFQTRRRKLNLFRQGNIISDSVGKKMKKQRQGMFGRGRKRKK